MNTLQKLEQALNEKNIAFSSEADEDGDKFLKIDLGDDGEMNLFPNEKDNSVFFEFDDGCGFRAGFRYQDVETVIEAVEDTAEDREITLTPQRPVAN